MENCKGTILITGINGFLGSSIAKKLSKTYNIVGLEAPNSSNSRLTGYSFKTYYSSDLLDAIFTEQQIDYIIHTATLFGRNNESISELVVGNLLFPIKLTEAAKKYGVKGFVNTHTSLPRNTSNYSLSKSQFLEWLLLFQSSMRIVNVVPEHFYGIGAGDTNFVTSIIKKMMDNVPFLDLTLGDQRRDFVHIDDMVNAYCLIVEQINLLPLYSEFEIASGAICTIKDMVLMIHHLTSSTTILNFGAIPYRENELMQSECNNANITALGWTPRVKLEMGIKSIIEAYNNKS